MPDTFCGQCGNSFKYKRNLVTHEKKHNGTLPFSCCWKGFPSKTALQRHRCSVHDEERTFVCVKCGSEFATRADLLVHRRREDNEKNIYCDICGRKTVTQAEMWEHLKTHGDDKTFTCTVCGKAYKHEASLRRHMGNKHKD